MIGTRIILRNDKDGEQNRAECQSRNQKDFVLALLTQSGRTVDERVV